MTEGGGPVVGSIGVGVVPDATEFWRRFQAQTEGGGVEQGRRLGREIRAGMEEELHDTDIRVGADIRDAEARLAALRAEIAALGESEIRVGVKTDGGGGFGGLATAAIALGPALIPIAGGAAAIGAGFAGAGAAGIAAFAGVRHEMEANTLLGQRYNAQLGEMKVSLAGIEQAAASAASHGFGKITAVLDQAAPQLRLEIGELAGSTSDIVAHLVGGLANGLQTFEPLMQHVLDFADRAAAKFEEWSTGPGGAKFAQTLSTTFDEIVPVLGNIVELAGHLVAAFAPIGGTSLQAINVFAEAINSLPVPVLQAAATAFVAFTVAAKTSAVLGAASAALRTFAAAEGEAAAASGARGLAGALGLGVARAVPYVATLAAVEIGVAAAARATDSWGDSQNRLAVAGHAAFQGTKDIITFHWTSYSKDVLGAAHALNTLQAAQSDINAAFTPGEISAKIAKAQAEFAAGVANYGDLSTQATLAGDAATRDKARQTAEEQKTQLAALQANIAQLQAAADLINHTEIAYTSGIEKINAASDAYVLHQIGKGPIDQATAAFAALDKGIAANIASEKTWTDAGKGQKISIDGVNYSLKAYQAAIAESGGSTEVAIGILDGHRQALALDKEALHESQVQQANLNAAVGAAEGKFKLTGQEVSLYATAAGIAADKVADGSISTAHFADAIGLVSKSLANGTTAVDGWLAAIAQFQGGEDTAATRGALIGAALKAANGDLLAYSGAVAGATSANDALVESFQQQVDQVKQGQLAFQDTERATIDLKTGLIDLSKKGAGPLTGQLQAIQDAAEKAAGATYQHELATRGATKASDDAVALYISQTRGALIDEAAKLGLTKDQAKGFADQYFGLANAKDIKKRIEMIGQDKILGALQGILVDLDVISGKTKLKLEMDTTSAVAKIAQFDAYLASKGIKPGGVFGAAFIANGGIFEAYANGGITNRSIAKFAEGDHTAQIGTGLTRVWNEPETGGEAYIPLAASKRSRSEAILADVASRFGGQYGRGGGSSSSKTVNVTQNNYFPSTARLLPTPVEMRRASARLGV